MTAPVTDLWSILNPAFEAGISGWALYGALAVLGLLVGILTGLFGVGGGFILVPLMNVIIGVPYEIAVGSSLSMIIGASTAGTLTNRKQGTINVRVAALIAAGSALGSILGDLLQSALIGWLGAGAAFTRAMHALFLLLLALSAYFTVRKTKRASAAGHTDPESAGSETGAATLFVIGLGLGVLTGLLGIGGGVLLIPILLTFVGLGERSAAGTSIGVVLVAAVIGTIKKGLDPLAKISMPVVVALLLASTVGVQFGNALGKKLRGDRFRRWYVVVLAVAAALIVWDILVGA